METQTARKFKVDLIGAYRNVCKELPLEKFCELTREPFFLHSMLSGSIVPTDATRGLTTDRLVLADNAGHRVGEIQKGEMFNVYPVIAKNPETKVISLGCSSECDVQINDQSLSRIHAYMGFSNGTYVIQDNGSTAGTQLNGRMLEPCVWEKLGSSDRVTLGYVDLNFLLPADFYRFVRGFLGITG